MKIIIAQTLIESAMHGVAWFSLPLKRGRTLTAFFSDGTQLSAEVSEETCSQIRAYYRYANENGPECQLPSGFHLISEIHHLNRES